MGLVIEDTVALPIAFIQEHLEQQERSDQPDRAKLGK
jgi:hypothetical protein